MSIRIKNLGVKMIRFGVRMILFGVYSSGAAQLVERSTSMRKVAGSIPGGGKKNISQTCIILSDDRA